MTGTVQFGSGPATAITITVSPTVMTSYAIYGSNPAATCTTSAGACNAAINASGVVAKAVADYFAGLNFGFIGSNDDQPEHAGTHDWKLALIDLVWQSAGKRSRRPP